jgi:hypothetical protein
MEAKVALDELKESSKQEIEQLKCEIEQARRLHIPISFTSHINSSAQRKIFRV